MTETISVIMPAFNSAATLPRAIESIRAQDWPDLEIVVVDDGSSDSTPAVLEGLAGSDLRVIRHGNAGPGAARNLGIGSSKGKWVAFLDSDDAWFPGKLGTQMRLLRSDSSLCFCYTDSMRRAVDGVERLHKPRCRVGKIFADLLLGAQFDLGTVMVRRDCFDRVGLFATELRTGEDWDMWLRLAAVYPGCYVPKPLFLYQESNDPEKYPLGMYERCQMLVLDRLFSNREIARIRPRLSRHRRQVYSWHKAVLAKSYLFRGQRGNFLRLAAGSIRSHPLGLYFLARKWKTAARWPDFAAVL